MIPTMGFERGKVIVRVRFKHICVLFCFMLTLCSCGKPEQTAQIGSEAWEKMPEVTFGVLESEQIALEAWNCGRAEETSRYALCETEKGLYIATQIGTLYYADKERLDNWVVVCNKADCDHLINNSNCAGRLLYNRVIAKNGRLYYAAPAEDTNLLSAKRQGGDALYSRAPNGSDQQQAYYLAQTAMPSGGRTGNYLTSRYWLVYANQLDTKGGSRLNLFRTDENGTKQLWQEDRADGLQAATLSPWSFASGMNGDELFYCDFLGEPGIFLFSQEEPVRVELPDVPALGAYYAGDNVRYFRQNEGYYDVDIRTGEEVFLGSAQLQNSFCSILLPNLTVESTLLYPVSTRNRTPGAEHGMAIFDGQQWHSVGLPLEMKLADARFFLSVLGVTSDAVWFSYQQTVTETVDKIPYHYQDTHLYRVGLDGEEWVLEYMATVKQPRVQPGT